MSYSTKDLNNVIGKLVDYEIILQTIEQDLNVIADHIITDPQDRIEFKLFLDIGEFETQIPYVEAGEGKGFYITPAVLEIVDGDFSTEKGPQVFTNIMSLIVSGLERDKENIRKILTTYAKLNHGKVDVGADNRNKVSKSLGFPIMLNSVAEKGALRTTFALDMAFTFIYQGELFNSTKIWINDKEIDAISASFAKSSVINAVQRNNEDTVGGIVNSQATAFSITFIDDGSLGALELIEHIENPFGSLNKKFSITIQKQNRAPKIYNMIFADGTSSGQAGSYMIGEATFNMADREVR